MIELINTDIYEVYNNYFFIYPENQKLNITCSDLENYIKTLIPYNNIRFIKGYSYERISDFILNKYILISLEVSITDTDWSFKIRLAHKKIFEEVDVKDYNLNYIYERRENFYKNFNNAIYVASLQGEKEDFKNLETKIKQILMEIMIGE